MNALFQKLFPEGSEYDEANYLEFLSRHMPSDLEAQLVYDGGTDLGLDEYVEVEDLMRPLVLRAFPHEWDSKPAFRLACVLDWLVHWYYPRDAKHDPYKEAYIASFYLYSCVYGNKIADSYLKALVLLVRSAPQMPLEGQLQVCRFLGMVIPGISKRGVDDPTPMSSVFIALSLIVANITNELSSLAEDAIREEEFEVAWREQVEDESFRVPWMNHLARQVVAEFGASGNVRRAADRFHVVKPLTTEEA